jgi:glucose-1-phosphate thymidylyltransferase
MKAIILAAGYATRLYPLTLNIPKPLLKVTADKTVIDLMVDDLASCGVRDITVVTNRKFFGVFKIWAQRRGAGRRSLRLTVLDDGTTSNDNRLGAVGDMYFAVCRRRVAEDLVVVGGDNLFDRGFKPFLAKARAWRPYASLGLFDIRDKKEATRFGVVSVDRQGRVLSFEEKPLRPRTSCVATCLYFFPAATLPLLKRYMADQTTSKDAPGNYIRWLMQHDRVYGHALKEGNWYDIGRFDAYRDVVAEFNGKIS